MNNQNIFTTRLDILVFIHGSRKAVSNVELQCNATHLTKCALNRILAQFVEWDYLVKSKDGNKFLYSASEKTKLLFGEKR